MEVNAEPLSSQPDDLIEPMWLMKFKQWATLQKSCPAARGPSGIYCSWEGRNCGYTSCPRRIFEEELVDITKIPKPKPIPVKLKKQLQTQAKAIQQLQDRNDELSLKITELEKKIV